jgi:hypothetical protein
VPLPPSSPTASQVDAAAAVGIRSTHISASELGERGLVYKTMLSLLRTYSTTLGELAAEIKRSEG